ncbi:MAG TPA: DsbA family protein [Longimicrobiales bacterium]|nr:DsbA family protein [Longimicrobiales bacterium]
MKSTSATRRVWPALMVALAACGGGEAALEPVEVEGLDDNARVLELAQGMVMGNPDAPVTIVEFGDYQCPGCGQFAALVKPQIEQVYAPGDDVKFVFYDFPLVTIHPHAFLAARASRCAAEQDAYWDYHTSLFRNQSAWSRSSTAPLGLFEDYAAELGMNEGDFNSCLRSDRYADVVTANMQLGNILGVGSTPTVLVGSGGNSRPLMNNSFQGIQEAVETLLAELPGGTQDGGEDGADGGA